MDTLDIEIIRILQKNARTPFSDIAKTLHVPASVVQIRFNKMKKAGIVLGTTLTLNPEKFGVKYAVSLGVKAIEPELQEVMKYMSSLTMNESKVSVWPTFGRFNILALVMSRNLLEAHKIKQAIKEHPYVTEVSISVNISWYDSKFESLGLEKELRS